MDYNQDDDDDGASGDAVNAGKKNGDKKEKKGDFFSLISKKTWSFKPVCLLYRCGWTPGQDPGFETTSAAEETDWADRRREDHGADGHGDGARRKEGATR